MAALIWFAAGALLIAGEAISGDFVLIMLGVGALLAAVATVLGAPVWLAAIIFGVVSVGLVAVARPAIKHRIARNPGIATGVDALQGQEAIALSTFGNAGGQVRIGSDTWTARPALETDLFQAGERLIVQRIDGATAIVERGN